MRQRKDRLGDVEEENLRQKHKAVFSNLRYYRERRMGLGFILFEHYRKLIYAVVIVFF